MSLKKQRKEIAKKKNKKRRKVAIAISAIIVIAITGLIIMAAHSERNSRVFSDGRQTVNLMQNGNFNAQLNHGVNKRGTYSEETVNGAIEIVFLTNGVSERGSIVDDVLVLPSEWDDGCGHNDRLPQRRGSQ
jgi:ABC-type uncharacterized transport system permease subunit